MCGQVGTSWHSGQCWLLMAAHKGHLGAWGLDTPLPQPITFYVASAFAQSLREARAIPLSPGWVLLPVAWVAFLAR